jgi:hypothetical protein
MRMQLLVALDLSPAVALLAVGGHANGLGKFISAPRKQSGE